ncbi:MAG: MurR/RpiR family transcriptional regulator, partial [Mesorhizobium sp.]
MSLGGATMDERVPRDFETLRTTILERRHSLPKRIAQIAAYALDNPDDIAFGTAASIAASAGVQPSTLIRFAQQLGFDGFTSLQLVFRERLRERNSSYDERLAALRAKAEEGAGHRAIFDGFVAAASTSLSDISGRLNEDHFEDAIALLAKAETIYVLAKRRSYPVASYIAYALGKLKIRNQLIESAAGLNAEMISFASPRDAVIAISFSPYAPAAIEEARVISEQGVPIVAITDSSFSPLAQFA